MISFDKMHGNGNDFIVLNSIDNTHKLSKSKIKKLSDRNFGIGFDQVILIGPPTKDSFDFSIRFFNADGGEASMCLNGIRCAASYVWRNNFAPKKSCFVIYVQGLNKNEFALISYKLYLSGSSMIGKIITVWPEPI